MTLKVGSCVVVKHLDLWGQMGVVEYLGVRTHLIRIRDRLFIIPVEELEWYPSPVPLNIEGVEK